MFPNFYKTENINEIYLHQAYELLKDLPITVLEDLCSDITELFKTSIVTYKNCYNLHEQWIDIFNILKELKTCERKKLIIFISKLIELPHHSIVSILNLLIYGEKTIEIEKDEIMGYLLEFYRISKEKYDTYDFT